MRLALVVSAVGVVLLITGLALYDYRIALVLVGGGLLYVGVFGIDFNL